MQAGRRRQLSGQIFCWLWRKKGGLVSAGQDCGLQLLLLSLALALLCVSLALSCLVEYEPKTDISGCWYAFQPWIYPEPVDRSDHNPKCDRSTAVKEEVVCGAPRIYSSTENQNCSVCAGCTHIHHRNWCRSTPNMFFPRGLGSCVCVVYFVEKRARP